MPFLSFPPPPPQLNPPPSPIPTIPPDFVHVSFIIVPAIPSSHCLHPTPPGPLLDCSQPQCFWLYFVCFFLLLIMFQLKVRSYGIQKLWYIYTMEFYAAERKKELIPFTIDLMAVLYSSLAFAQFHPHRSWSIQHIIYIC